MSTPSLFEDPDDLRHRLARRLFDLAARNVWIGGSSWKYEGWLGSIYTPSRYSTRGKFSRKKFEETCLVEYAETFPIVCGDFSFYQFPSPDYWAKLFLGSPSSLHFGFKVPEEITVKTWPTHARYGPRAGHPNENFLDAALFETAFARPLEPYRARVRVLIFEFGTFSKSQFENVDRFLESLDPFLAKLPPGFRYAVEIRNPEFLCPAYLDCLRSHNIAHVYNSWTRMPDLDTQLDFPRSETASFTVTRALLRPGRTYEEAVALFQPYREVQEVNERGRAALRRLIEQGLCKRDGAIIFLNNRYEGNSPETIAACVEGSV